MTNPRKSAETLCHDLHISPVPSIDHLIGKKTTPHPSHFFRPGIGKWRQYMTAEHMEILKELAYDKIMKDLGYHWEPYETDTKPYIHDKSLISFIREDIVEKDILYRSKYLPSGLRISGNSATMFTGLIQILQSSIPYYQLVLGSLDTGTFFDNLV